MTTDFTQLVNDFLHVVRDIYKSRGEDDPLVKQLTKFEYVVEKSKGEDIETYFRDLYNSHRSAILLGPMYDYWLREKNVVVDLTQDLALKKGKGVKLNLSVVYRIALTHRDNEQEVVRLLLDWERLRGPLYLLNSLYRIFNYLDKEEKKLEVFLSQLETVMTDEEIERDTIGSYITNLAQKLGLKTSDAPIKESDISEAFAAITENPDMGNIMNIVAQARNGGGPPDMNKLVDSIKNLPMVKDMPSDMMDSVMSKLKESVVIPNTDLIESS